MKISIHSFFHSFVQSSIHSFSFCCYMFAVWSHNLLTSRYKSKVTPLIWNKHPTHFHEKSWSRIRRYWFSFQLLHTPLGWYQGYKENNFLQITGILLPCPHTGHLCTLSYQRISWYQEKKKNRGVKKTHTLLTDSDTHLKQF